MKNKRFFRTVTVMLAAVIFMCGFSATAYAGGGESYGEEIPTDDSNVVADAAEPQPLTPEGNMSLVDDIAGDSSEDKQFITVVTKSGNYFYIIIDNAADGENTVHFLNQVDEADLMALMEDGQSTAQTAVCNCTEKCEAGSVNLSCPVCKTDTSGCTGTAAVTEPEPADEPQEEEKSGTGGLVIFLVIALLGGGVALYYFKVMKPKQSVKGNTDLEDLDFDEYDEDEQPEVEEQEDDEE